MQSQLLSEQSLGVDTFVALVRAHATATRSLAQLSAEHGLTISDYEVLLRLARAPERRLRRVDLAEQVLLTASGITRLLDGLERQGWVERAACDEAGSSTRCSPMPASRSSTGARRPSRRSTCTSAAA